MVITPTAVGTIRPATLIVARPVPSQQDVDTMVLQIQSAATGPELDALGLRIGGLSATQHGDPSQRARLAQLRLAMRVRRDQLGP
jgi:hypothetical protein